MLGTIILYKYFLYQGSIKPADMKWVVEYHKKHRVDRGKFWCWHDWHLFEVVPQGYLPIGITDVICGKCGKVRKGHPNHEDARLIDYGRFVSWQ